MYRFGNMWFIILFIVITLFCSQDYIISNKYLTSTTYQMIDVNQGDSLWTISAKYVTDKDDIRHLISAIKDINQLDNNTQIYPGQLLKIPVMSDTMNTSLQ